MKIHLNIIVSTSLLLPGCASFDGMPEPVIKADVAKKVTTRFDYDRVLASMDKMTPAERTNYRNRVVSAYFMATDAKYYDFRRKLSRGIKGSNIGFDAALLGLTGAASVASGAANALSAAATGVAGARATLNRELYFEKTLPALVALLDAKRLTVRADIIRGLSQTEREYSMEEAFSDLWRYQMSASLDGAIQQVAAQAAKSAEAADVDYSKAVELCQVDEGVATSRRELMIQLENDRKTPDGRARFAKAAIAAGMADATATEDEAAYYQQQQAIASNLLAVCSAAEFEAFKAKTTAAPQE